MVSNSVSQLADRLAVKRSFVAAYLSVLRTKIMERRLGIQEPSNEVLADAILQKGYSELPAPSEVAKEIKEKVVEKQKEIKKTLMQQEENKRKQVSNKHQPYRNKYWQEKQQSGYEKLYDVEKTEPSHLEPGVKPYSALDKERVNKEDLQKCKHGVPFSQLCALCNRENFREITGIN
jgi:hypothetical protein